MRPPVGHNGILFDVDVEWGERHVDKSKTPVRNCHEMVVDRDPLDELPQLGALEEDAQLGLAHEDDLQEVIGLGVHIGEHAQLLQRLGREILGLVDDQRHPAALGIALDQVIQEDLVLLDGAKPIYLDVFKLIEPRLRPGARIIADDADSCPEGR